MSLYNSLFGFHPLASLVLHALGSPSIQRFRDAWVDVTTKEMVVLTRTGGGNREEYLDANTALAKHELYIRDEDDDFDATYARFYFRIPANMPHLETVGANLPPQPTLKEKFDRAIETIGGGGKP